MISLVSKKEVTKQPERKRCPREKSRAFKDIDVCRKCKWWEKCKAWKEHDRSLSGYL